MYCPFCSASDTKVVDSRLSNECSQVRRRRECLACVMRFTTYEQVELLMPWLIKRDGSRVAFVDEKLRAGMLRALEKRAVSTEKIEAALQRIHHKLRAQVEREVSSRILGQWVMDELCDLDQVAYIRFASVYWSFENIMRFKELAEQLAELKEK